MDLLKALESPQALGDLAEAIGADLRKSGPVDGIRRIVEGLAVDPPTVLRVLELLLASSAGRGKARRHEGLMFMFGGALEIARWNSEGGSAAHRKLIDDIRSRLTKAARTGKPEAPRVMGIAQAFAAAKLDIGDAFRTALTEAIGSTGPVSAGPQLSPADELGTIVGEFARDLDHDPFAIFEQVFEISSVVPTEMRAVMAATMTNDKMASVREAAVGWLLDSSAEVAGAVGGALAQAAGKGLVSAASIGRLVNLRNWVGPERRVAIDAITRAALQQGIQTAAALPAQIGGVFITPCDGAGAQSCLLAIKRNRTNSLCGVLAKMDIGIRDAWVRRDLPGKEIASTLAQVSREMPMLEGALEGVLAIVGHSLAVNQRSGERIPFGLLHVLEAAGLPAPAPAQVEPQQLIDRLMSDIAEDRRQATDIARALARSGKWPDEFSWLETWREEGEQIAAILEAKSNLKDRVAAVLAGPVVRNRTRWGEQLAWTALAGAGDTRSDSWIDFALVARELLGSRPLAEIPLANFIARASVQAARGKLR